MTSALIGQDNTKGSSRAFMTRAGDVRLSLCFFFQAEDGIRDLTVTGVQTCALPIFPVEPFTSEDQFARERQRLWPRVWLMVGRAEHIPEPGDYFTKAIPPANASLIEIGRASCRERV